MTVLATLNVIVNLGKS